MTEYLEATESSGPVNTYLPTGMDPSNTGVESEGRLISLDWESHKLDGPEAHDDITIAQFADPGTNYGASTPFSPSLSTGVINPALYRETASAQPTSERNTTLPASLNARILLENATDVCSPRNADIPSQSNADVPSQSNADAPSQSNADTPSQGDADASYPIQMCAPSPGDADAPPPRHHYSI
jgi:hypothetical protein